MGSGSTLVAASQCKRKSIGIEIDPSYCELAVTRIKKEGRLH
jgi:DNA modification methylase